MPKAETVSTTSRRNFLTAAAVAGAIVAPKIAVGAPNPDAELIRLGQELSKLTQEYYSEMARMRPFWDEHKRLMDNWRKNHPTFKAGEDVAAYRQFRVESGMDAAEKENHPDDVIERYAPVAAKIRAIPALTWTGVVVKAQLARFAADHLWDQPEADLDSGDLAMRKLCDAVMDMAARTAAAAAS